ncbi:MAG: hypothetical protein JXJ17_00410 [Anaerolineae bacterium]|nr:hypothetical protein [Anaerolineae bacterium]
MRRIETVAIGLIFGAVPVITCGLAGWWLIIPYVPERLIFVGLLAGFVTGIVIDVLFLKRWIRRAYSMRPIAWSGIYLFYSVGLFGMFMGVPIFNVGLAVPAGCFVGAYLANREAPPPEVKTAARRSSLVTTGILALICGASATVALIDPYTAGNLQGLLGLPFHVTPMMIIGLILIGGSFLLALQWWITKTSVELTYRYFVRHAG